MPKRSDPGRAGKRLLEEAQTLGGKLRAEERQPGDVSAWPRETRHEAVCDGIAHDRHDDGDRGGRTLDSAGRRRIGGEDEVELETGQLIRQTLEMFDLPICRSVFDEDVLPST
jgi:hypothetical protein